MSTNQKCNIRKSLCLVLDGFSFLFRGGRVSHAERYFLHAGFLGLILNDSRIVGLNLGGKSAGFEENRRRI
jgi:hypothetical protein